MTAPEVLTMVGDEPVDSSLPFLLHRAFEQVTADPPDMRTIVFSLTELVEFLASEEGRTPANCWATGLFFIVDTWDAKWSQLPTSLVDVLDTISELHDEDTGPGLTEDSLTTPEMLQEQLLDLSEEYGLV